MFIENSDIESIKATGYHLGITESTKYLIATLNFSSTTWEVENPVATNTYSLFGTDVSIGPNFKYIKPRLIVGNVSLKAKDDNESVDYRTNGYGIMLSFPITKKFFLYASYDKFKATPTDDFEGFDEFKYDRAMVGIRFYIFTLERFGGAKVTHDG